MANLKHSQAGFGLIETLLIIIALTLIVGVGFYIKDSGTKTTATKPTTATPAIKTQPPVKVSDTDQIIAAVKSYTGASVNGTPSPNAQVDASTITIVGDNAKGSVSFPPDGGGAAFIAHKDSSGTWKVIFEGQQAPDPSLAAQYGLPTAWYMPSN